MNEAIVKRDSIHDSLYSQRVEIVKLERSEIVSDSKGCQLRDVEERCYPDGRRWQLAQHTVAGAKQVETAARYTALWWTHKIVSSQQFF